MSGGGFFILILVGLLLIWAFLVRPQRRRQQARQSMIEAVEPGDEVLTAGGFYAHVVRVLEDEVVVELSPGVEARVAKRAIAAIMPIESDEDDEYDEHDEHQEAELEATPPTEPVEEQVAAASREGLR
jgi:preprotein translocase subunit YajC